MLNTRFIIIQLVGLAGTAFYFMSFQFRENRKLFIAQFISYAFYTVHLVLLGAVTGGVSYVINTFRSLCLASKWEFARSKKMCIIICVLQTVCLLITWDGWISLLPVTANIAVTIGGYTHDPRKIRLSVLLINSPMWIIYNIIVGSWAGVLDEAVCETSIMISIARFGLKSLGEAEQ